MLDFDADKLTAVECLLKCADVAAGTVSAAVGGAEAGQELYNTVMNGALEALLKLGVSMEEFTIAGLRLLAADEAGA